MIQTWHTPRVKGQFPRLRRYGVVCLVIPNLVKHRGGSSLVMNLNGTVIHQYLNKKNGRTPTLKIILQPYLEMKNPTNLDPSQNI
jgi:hypothetical protein